MIVEYENVKAFHKTFGHPIGVTPTFLERDRVEKRYCWMYEELQEFDEAETVVDQADAMIDLIYFAIGTLVEMGVRPVTLWDIVQRANMSKVFPDGAVKRRESDGKVIKPDNWIDPKPLLIAEIERQKSNVL
jgi:predicted HAD superfamily Cof-like phosphohydrolase